MITVYLGGRIRGCTDEQCKAWREQAKRLLVGFSIRDPMERDYRGRDIENIKPIIEGDLKDIRESDVLLVNASEPSWGSPMEIIYAKVIMGKRVVAFGAGKRPSPWLAHHAELFPTLESACQELRRTKTTNWLRTESHVPLIK